MRRVEIETAAVVAVFVAVYVLAHFLERAWREWSDRHDGR